ncbi:MAG TPA: D-alanine--D-alanine ligase [Dissulfurispiraceae bacterium]|nr:D-alanine--D-alanine ligase [Dissulfurispiraceae bacterium]
MTTKKRIGVLAGGTSAEREVSLKSGGAVFKALQERGYDAVFIDAAGDIHSAIMSQKVEMVFIALHGGHGENGAVQGYLEVMGIPYTGSGVLASALAMDKEASKKIFRYHGVPVPPFVILRKDEIPDDIHALAPGCLVGGSMIDFGMPWVIKPATEGSSIGVHIVKNGDELEAALGDALKYGDKIIVEQYIKGKEIQIGILGQKALGGVEVRPSAEFYNYEAKYTPGMTSYILPPEVSEEDYAELRAVALCAHDALGCSGATRVDIILTPDHRTYLLEVNTIPGMTETSLLPKIAKLAGLDFGDLIEEILKSAIGEDAGA